MPKYLNLDTDSNLTANSDYIIPSQKAIKTALDKKANIEDIEHLPSQADNSGKFLTTDGENTSWKTIISIKDWSK